MSANTLITRLRERVANASTADDDVTVVLTQTSSIVTDVPAGKTVGEMAHALKQGICPDDPTCLVVVGAAPSRRGLTRHSTKHATRHMRRSADVLQSTDALGIISLQSTGVSFTVTTQLSSGSLAAPTVDTAAVAADLGVTTASVNVGEATVVDVAAAVTVVSSGDQTSAAQAAAAQSQALDPAAVASELGVSAADVAAQPVTTAAPPLPPTAPSTLPATVASPPPASSPSLPPVGMFLPPTSPPPAATPSPSPAAAPALNGLAPPASPSSAGASASSSCFGRETSMACRVRDTKTSAHAAFTACFHDGGAVGDAELVRMVELRAADPVLSLDEAGAPAITRVVLNQHVDDVATATALLRIETANGAAITITPDHVIAIGGHRTFAAVRSAAALAVTPLLPLAANITSPCAHC
jgi:hypothetical protein